MLNTTWLIVRGRRSPASTSRKVRRSRSAETSTTRPSQSKKVKPNPPPRSCRGFGSPRSVASGWSATRSA
ncbi:hypothetical protein ACFPM0_23870 [Pseudonocardia sulfidoxydans]|uniref:hypothetical protein n=1 Tax=Pseudonocardia sulfidoxydans TaxID=54011 RepID=UPI00361CF48F